jgi:hypothetical protein
MFQLIYFIEVSKDMVTIHKGLATHSKSVFTKVFTSSTGLTTKVLTLFNIYS